MNCEEKITDDGWHFYPCKREATWKITIFEHTRYLCGFHVPKKLRDGMVKMRINPAVTSKNFMEAA